jgi:hypothetical protein
MGLISKIVTGKGCVFLQSGLSVRLNMTQPINGQMPKGLNPEPLRVSRLKVL